MELFHLLGTILISNTAANSAIDETTGRAENSESKMSKAFKKVGTAVAGAFAVDKIVNFGKAAIDTTASFEDGMLKVQSLSGATQEEYEKLSKAALDYGSTTAWSAKDVSDAMGYMALAGFDTNQILESTSGMLSLASASGEDLATVTDILTDSMTGFGDSADQASRYADVLATTQAKSNTSVGDLGEAFKYVSSLAGTYSYSLEDVSAALGTMANAGVKGSMAGTSLSSIITRLGTNTSGARDAIEKLGVSFYNQDGTARNLGDVLKDLCDATEDMDVAQKAEFASTVAGAEAQKGLLAILNQGSDAYENLQGKLYDCSGAASDMASNMESGLGGSIRSLQSAWEGFQIKLGEKIEPGVSAGLSKLTEFIQNKAMPAIDAISDGMSSILDWMKEHEKAVQAVAGALEVAAAAMVAFKAGAAIQSVIKSFQEAKLAIALFSMSTEGATVAQGLLNGTLTIGEGIVALLTGKMTLAQLAQAGMAKGQAALNAVMSANPIGLVIAAITALVAAFVILWNKSDAFRNFWISAWNKIKSVVTSAASTIKSKVTALGNAIVNAFKSLPSKMASTGKNIVQGLWNGISNAKSWILSKIKGFGESILSGIKGFFGIHSPSTVMRDEVGKQLALGVAEGISKNKDYAKKSATDLAKVILDAATKKLDTFKTYNDMTLAEEVAFWDNVRKQIASGTDERLTADKNYLSAKKSLDEKLQAAEDEYQKKIDETNQKIEDRAKNILNSFKLFDEFDQGEDVQGSTLIKSLETQVDALEKWHEQIGVLKEKLGDTDLFESIQEMGVSSLKQVESLNNMSEEQLEAYVEMYDKRQQLAKEQAQDELADENAKTIAEAYQTWVDTCSDLGVTVKDTNDEMEKSVESSMKNIVDNVSKKMEATAQAVKTGIETIKDAFNSLSTLNISMPDISATGAAKLNNAGDSKKPTAFSIKPNNSKAETGTSSDTVNNIAAAVSNSNKSIVSDILNGLAGLGVGAAKIPEKIVTQVQLDKKSIAEATYDYTAQRGSKLVGV